VAHFGTLPFSVKKPTKVAGWSGCAEGQVSLSRALLDRLSPNLYQATVSQARPFLTLARTMGNGEKTTSEHDTLALVVCSKNNGCFQISRKKSLLWHTPLFSGGRAPLRTRSTS